MKTVKIIFVISMLVSFVSCLKSDVCECSTYDYNGEFILTVSNANGIGTCSSHDTVISSSGDTNIVICETVRR